MKNCVRKRVHLKSYQSRHTVNDGVIMKVLLLILATLFVGCVPTPEKDMDEPTTDVRQETLSQIDVSACLDKGGVIKNVCMLAVPTCIQSYKDAGKECIDSSDCSGDCRIENEFVVAGAKTAGFCSADNNPCGCYQLVVNGKAEDALCAD